MKNGNYVKEKKQHELNPAEEKNISINRNGLPEINLSTPEFDKCRSILKQDVAKYSDEEIILIYTFIKSLAEYAAVEHLNNRDHEKSNFDVTC